MKCGTLRTSMCISWAGTHCLRQEACLGEVGTSCPWEWLSPCHPHCFSQWHMWVVVAARRPSGSAFKPNWPRINWPVGILVQSLLGNWKRTHEWFINGKLIVFCGLCTELHCLHSNPSPELCIFHRLCLSIPISLKDVTQPVLVLENWGWQGGMPCLIWLNLFLGQCF